MRLTAFAVTCVLSPGLFAASVPPLICASGSPIATVDLRVTSPSKQHENQPLPLRTMNLVEEGDIIRYKPVLRPRETRKGDVTLVLVPANKKAARENLKIFDPRPASEATQWTVPWRTSLVAFVYGPSGLSVKKVQAFLNSDDDLVGELADYADKTERTEALIAALTSPGSSGAAVNAAFQGFSSKFGAAVQLTKDAPIDQNAAAMFATLNPNIAAVDPLAPQAAQSVGQMAGLAAVAGEMFFGTPVGLAAGGAAMLLDLGQLAFPHSEFHAAFSQAMPDDALGLCGKAGASAAHTHVDYIWATRVPNAPEPRLTVGKQNSLPSAVKSPLPLTAEPGSAAKSNPLLSSGLFTADPSGNKAPPAATSADESWKYLNRARNWTLQPVDGKPAVQGKENPGKANPGKAIPVKAQVLANTKSIELDLPKDLQPGAYRLSADWDWDTFQVAGRIEVHSLADFASAKLAPASQDRLVPNAGKLVLTLQGADFEFVTKLQMKKLNDEFASASDVPFVLAKGVRAGEQDKMDIQIDTAGLETGSYKLIVSQVDGKEHDVPLKVLPPLPAISNLPVSVNQGTNTFQVDLKGSGLQYLKNLKLAKGTVTLGDASSDGTLRSATFKLAPGTAAGADLSLEATVADRSAPLTIDDALRVVGPKPAITEVSLSQLPTQGVHLDNGELPEGLILSALLRVSNFSAGSGVRLDCEQADSAAITLHPGQQTNGVKLEQLSSDQLFLTFDTSGWNNGCGVEATITSGVGNSAPHRIARVIDVPAVDEFQLAADGAPGQVDATLIGRNLETIDKTGWSPEQAIAVAALPQPLGDGRRQKLEVKLSPPPSPDATLYVWLRGDSKPRVTTVHATPY